MGEVVDLDMVTRLDIPVERVLSRALEADLQSVVLLAYDKDGEEYFASSFADGGDMLWLMRRAERKLLDIAE